VVESSQKHGFGTFFGVFVPNVTMMFGVILFLRLSVIVGNVGFVSFAGMVILALLFMVTTSLSIAMIVTNMRVGKGGVYYLISRALGIEVGGAVGIGLILSQLISLALCVSGFAYSLQWIFQSLNVSWIEMAALSGLAFISLISARFALRIQFLIFCLLLAAVGSVFFSQPVSPGHFEPFFPGGLTFWQAFALFYPALTGIEAGMALSGNLKNPSKSLWLGSLLSLLFVGAVYLVVALFLSFGFTPDFLKADPVHLIAQYRLPQLIYAGIWAATLSSALGNLVGGPRMLQMVSEDGIAPSFLGQRFGRFGEPRFATLVVFVLALFLILFTTIDQILPILTMVCLLTYGILNLVAGLAELVRGPYWRPMFRIPWPVSLFGAFFSFFLMIMIDPLWTFIAIGLFVGIYGFLRWRSIEVSFQDFRDSIVFFFSRFAIYHLYRSQEHPIGWHPQILTVVSNVKRERKLLHLASSLTERSGLLAITSLLPESWEDPYQLGKTRAFMEEFVQNEGIQGIVEVQAVADYYQGLETLLKFYGMGPLQPNTCFLEVSRKKGAAESLLPLIRAAHLNKKNLLLFLGAPKVAVSRFSVPEMEKKTIDIWWDSEYTGSFELMLSFVQALTLSPVWRTAKKRLRTTVISSSQERHLKRYFRTFVRKSRVKLTLLLQVNSRIKDLARAALRDSQGADLIFFPLKPIDLFEEEEAYKAYLERMFRSVRGSVPVILVTCYDTLPHRDIYL